MLPEKLLKIQTNQKKAKRRCVIIKNYILILNEE